MPKQIDLNIEARTKLMRGASTLTRTVAATYGPKGRTVILDRAAGILATKDGVTVAREIDLEDRVENLGAQLLLEACVKVNDTAGDGTTSAAIVANAILEESHKLVVAGMDPMRLARGISAAARRAVTVVEDLAMNVEGQAELQRVAFVASNGDTEVADALAEACMAVGKDGTISIEDGHGLGIELEFKEGMEIDKGLPSPVFLGSATVREMTNPLVAVINAVLSTVDDIKEILEVASQWPDNPLIVIAQDITGHAMVTMAMNDSKSVMNCIPIQAPGFGDRKTDNLKDIAALAGATFIDPALNMDFRKGFDPEWFGSFRKVEAKLRSTLFVALPEAQEIINERKEHLKREMASLDSDYDRDRLSERIAKLAGGLCIVQVGGPTEAALKERRARIEDALGAVRGALKTGVVPGAGTAYLTASDTLLSEAANDGSVEATGWKVLAQALRAPLYQLAINAGVSGDMTVHKVLEARKDDEYGWIGWDANSDTIRDLGEEPLVLDPALVVLSVLRAASSVASTMLTVEASIVEFS